MSLRVHKKFESMINDGLKNGEDRGTEAYQQLKRGLSKHEINPRKALENALRLYRRAQAPDNFFEVRITEPNERFDECYKLMTHIFKLNVIDPKERYINWLESTREGSLEFPYVLVARILRVEGNHKYDLDGNLIKFGLDTNVVTERIVSFASGNYMPIWKKGKGRTKEGIGAIGHLATVKKFRKDKRYSHGTRILNHFIKIMEEIARKRGERLLAIALEAGDESKGFWYKKGFRWPENTVYAQPPLIFNLTTGKPKFDEVPQYLMILNRDHTDKISKELVLDIVRTMYYYWCIKKYESVKNGQTKRAIAGYIWGKVFKRFVRSVKEYEGKNIRLISPPNRLYHNLFFN